MPHLKSHSQIKDNGVLQMITNATNAPVNPKIKPL
jgi:hypothetical protein